MLTQPSLPDCPRQPLPFDPFRLLEPNLPKAQWERTTLLPFEQRGGIVAQLRDTEALGRERLKGALDSGRDSRRGSNFR